MKTKNIKKNHTKIDYVPLVVRIFRLYIFIRESKSFSNFFYGFVNISLVDRANDDWLIYLFYLVYSKPLHFQYFGRLQYFGTVLIAWKKKQYSVRRHPFKKKNQQLRSMKSPSTRLLTRWRL